MYKFTLCAIAVLGFSLVGNQPVQASNWQVRVSGANYGFTVGSHNHYNRGYSGYNRGFNNYCNYGYGNSNYGYGNSYNYNYGRSYNSYYRQPHLHYHPGHYARHNNHYHYHPGHYDLHR